MYVFGKNVLAFIESVRCFIDFIKRDEIERCFGRDFIRFSQGAIAMKHLALKLHTDTGNRLPVK